MPFGKKTDLTSGIEINFDQIYESAIKPAVIDAGLEPLRGDEEALGGIIHSAMFARLLLSEYVVADLTVANPNVYYELGIRHAAKPYTTVLICANLHPLPFDVSVVRTVLYNLEKGQITEQTSQELRKKLKERLEQAIHGQAQADSPLFELIPHYPGIDLPHDVTDAFRDRIKEEEQFKEKLDKARAEKTNEERRKALLKIQNDLGDLKTVQNNILVSLLLAFRSIEAWDEMVNLCELFSDSLKTVLIVKQQWAFALNRRNREGDRKKAIAILEKIVKDHGADAETLGLLGRIYKDMYKKAKKEGNKQAPAFLDKAIEAYQDGFKSDPRDYYPGVNAITLLIEKGDDVSLAKTKELAPLVSFAVARRGGISSNNYWDLATVLELACINEDWELTKKVLPKVLMTADESWMPKTTMDNLILLRDRLSKQQKIPAHINEIIQELRNQVIELEGHAQN
jgi:tetratricopeptide (TPR) repeat protein